MRPLVPVVLALAALLVGCSGSADDSGDDPVRDLPAAVLPAPTATSLPALPAAPPDPAAPATEAPLTTDDGGLVPVPITPTP